jgi:PQQ-dependent catabolism-associated CXXCW motif protein
VKGFAQLALFKSLGLIGPAILFFVVSAGFALAAPDGEAPPEPQAYRLDNYRAPTPATLEGRPGLTAAEAGALWKNKEAVFVDVLPQAPRPPDLAPGTIWREKPRDDIPGSIWLPDTGYGALAPETEAYLRAGLAAVTGGDSNRKIVFYCLKDCWMSWNAAKRAKTFGYANVLWYPGGTDGWVQAGLPLENRKPYLRD